MTLVRGLEFTSVSGLLLLCPDPRFRVTLSALPALLPSGHFFAPATTKTQNNIFMSEPSSVEKITTLKVPPHSIEAEQAVLSALMLDNSRWDVVSEILLPGDFYRKEHRLIFEAMQKQTGDSKPIDVITLSETLRTNNQLQEAGGIDYLGELVSTHQSAANIAAYAGIIKERAILRHLISVAHGIADSGYNPDGRDSAELLDAAEQAVFRIADDRPSDGGPQSLTPILKSAVNRIEKLFEAQGNITGISTGFKDLDEMTSGLQPADLVIVAGRPSMGKCIVSGSRLVDPRSGERRTIDDIVLGQDGRLHSLGTDWKLHTTSPSAFVNDGIKPVFRVTTAQGREIETTLTHPFLTGDGWKRLSELTPGVQIGVPRALPVFGDSDMPEHEIALLAYLTADGGLTSGCPMFTNTNQHLLDDFTRCVKAFGNLQVRRTANDARAPTLRVSANQVSIAEHRARFAATLRQRMDELRITGRALAQALNVVPATVTYWRQGAAVPQQSALPVLAGFLSLQPEHLLPAGPTSASHNSPNALTTWLIAQGLWGKLAIEKRIAASIFRLPRAQLALFLNRLFACDGSAYVQNENQGIVSYASSSRELARDVQHLLLRFGVMARLKHRNVKYQEGHREAWELVVTNQQSLRTFISEIGIFGKEEQLARVEAVLAQKQEHSNNDSLPDSATDYVLALKGKASWQEIFARKGIPCPEGYNPHLQGNSKRRLSRSRAQFFAELFDDTYLAQLASSDLYWDTITSIEFTGHKQVFDLTVPDTHNFVAEDVLVHNTTFAMNMVETAVLHTEKPVLVFSLEMPADSLIIRMLSSIGRIDQTRMRNGKLENEDWDKLSMAVAKLRNRPLFIDDTSGLSPSEMRARTRRVAREHGDIGMIMVDYLQLMQVKGSSENRTGEISEISRSLKLMAREFNCPVIALSQLNRSLEQRPNKRPVMSDLRECVTGETLVCLTDGRRVPIRELVGTTPSVWAMSEDQKIVAATSDKVWNVGRKPVFKVALASGRVLRATAKHRVFTGKGWLQVGELSAGDRMALAHAVPSSQTPESWSDDRLVLLGHLVGDGSYLSGQPLRYTTASDENSEAVSRAAINGFGVTVSRHEGRGNWHQLVFSGNGNRWHPAGVNLWLRELGIFNQRSHEKHLPSAIFQLPDQQIALLLRHLWATDGCMHVRTTGRGAHRVYFATCSRRLADDVAALLMRFGVIARIRKVVHEKGKPVYSVDISGKDAQLRFLDAVGTFGPREACGAKLREHLADCVSNTNVDTLPVEVFAKVRGLMAEQGIPTRRMAAMRGTAYGGAAHFKFAPSKHTLADYARLLNDPDLQTWADSDLFWDRVVEVVPDGEEDVYDLTVPGPASWLADGIVSHNSGAIEQDADVIMFVYRHEVYDPDKIETKGVAEIIIGKQRNGPIGMVNLSFIGKHTRFENFMPMNGFSPKDQWGE